MMASVSVFFPSLTGNKRTRGIFSNLRAVSQSELRGDILPSCDDAKAPTINEPDRLPGPDARPRILGNLARGHDSNLFVHHLPVESFAQAPLTSTHLRGFNRRRNT